jgi:hypothetical protein
MLTSIQTHSFSYSTYVSYTLLVVNKDEQDWHCKYNVTLRRIRATSVAVEKQQVLNSECASVALGNQHAMRMLHIFFRGLSGSTILFYIIYTTFGKKLLNIKCVLRSDIPVVYIRTTVDQ